jgi:hypothetical protein
VDIRLFIPESALGGINAGGKISFSVMGGIIPPRLFISYVGFASAWTKG